MARTFVFYTLIISSLGLFACSSASPPQEITSEVPAATDKIPFAQNGDVITVTQGEEVSFRLKLPDTVRDSITLWLPVEGKLDPELAIRRSFRSLQDDVYYTEHLLRGDTKGETTVTFAPINSGKIVDESRYELTFIVK